MITLLLAALCSPAPAVEPARIDDPVFTLAARKDGGKKKDDEEKEEDLRFTVS